jgi:hypothetical protein
VFGFYRGYVRELAAVPGLRLYRFGGGFMQDNPAFVFAPVCVLVFGGA